MLHAHTGQLLEQAAQLQEHELRMLSRLPLDERVCQLELAHGDHVALLRHLADPLAQEQFQLRGIRAGGDSHTSLSWRHQCSDSAVTLY